MGSKVAIWDEPPQGGASLGTLGYPVQGVDGKWSLSTTAALQDGTMVLDQDGRMVVEKYVRADGVMGLIGDIGINEAALIINTPAGPAFHYEPGYGSRPYFSRASVAQEMRSDGDDITEVVTGQIRHRSKIIKTDRTYELATLLEASRINVALDSNNFAAASAAWLNAADFTITEAPSIFSGQVAYKHVNLGTIGSRSRLQTIGVLTAAPETTSYIIEGIDAAKTSIGIRDNTASAWVVLAEFDWTLETMAISPPGAGTDASASARYLGIGPSGGKLFRLSVTGTPSNPGNVRRTFIYPSGTPQNTLSAIIHHAQHEDAATPSSPIISSSVAAGERAHEEFYRPWLSTPQKMTGYLRFFELGTSLAGGSLGLFGIGGATEVTPYVRVFGTAGRYRLDHHNGVGNQLSQTAASVFQYGDLIEMRITLDDDGTPQIHYSIESAAEVSAAAGLANEFAGAWGGERCYIGSRAGGISKGFNAFTHVHFELGNNLLSMDELREICGVI